MEKGWLKGGDLVQDDGLQIAALNYPHLSSEEIFDALAEFYKAFYFRPKKIMEITLEMLSSWEMMRRRLREGVEFFHFLRTRNDAKAA
jgi:hypothetical protein